MKVLFVDDEPEILELSKIYLEREDEGITVRTAVSVEEGLDLVEEEEFDCIVSDYQMPETDGLEFLKIVREKKTIDIPFIIFTGKGREEAAIDALNLGADRYLQKGGDPRSQYGVLAQAIGQEVKHKNMLMEKARVEAELSSLMKGAKDPIFIVDRDCRFRFANAAELDSHGMTAEEMIGTKFHDIHSKADSEELEEIVKKIMETGEPEQHEVKHGYWGRYFIRTFSPIRNPRTGKIDKVSVISSDITGRKEIEEELRRSEKRYRDLFESVNIGIVVHDPGGGIVSVNPYAEQTFGIGERELKEKDIEFWKGKLFRVDGEPMELEKFPITDIIESKEVEGGRVVGLSMSEGEKVRWYMVSGTPQIDEEGNLEKIITSFKEITKQKETEEDLRHYKYAVDESDDLVAAIDENYIYQFVNRHFLEYHQVSEQEVVGRSVAEVVGKEIFEEKIRSHVDRCLDGKRVQYEMKRTYPSLGERHLDVRYFPIEDGGKDSPKVVADIVDITELKEREEELKFQASLLDQAQNAIIATDVQGKVIYWNDRAEEFYGWKAEEAVGKEIIEVTPALASKELAAEIMQKLKQGEKWSGEFLLQRKDGTEFPAIVTDAPIYDENGEMMGIVGISTDISERKDAEERAEFLQSLLRHDLRNKIQISSGYVDLLKGTDLSDKQEALLEKDWKAKHDAIELIEKVSKLHKVGKDEVAEAELAPFIRSAVSKCQHMASERPLEIEFEEFECKVRAGPLLEELFTNLIMNSVIHSEGSNIRIDITDLGKEKIVLSVEDDGKGIPEEIRDSVFERGFKKGVTGGSGLGLFLVKEIAESYGGGVEIKDSDLGGARVDVILERA